METNFLMTNLLPMLLAFGVSLLLAAPFIKWLRKLKFGQEIRDEGPKWHESKSGTPTMGGIIFIVGAAVALIVTAVIALVNGAEFSFVADGAKIFLVALGFGIIGFADDYIKVVKKRNLGLTSKQKFLLQLLLAVIYIAASYFIGLDTEIIIPFTSITVALPIWLYIPLILFIIVGVVNAVNLTDGLDGLATAVTVMVQVTFAIIAMRFFDKIFVSNVAMALVGALFAFLFYNKYPAKVFMGDTGSLFLGAAVALMAIETKTVLYLVIIGFVYFAETLSVILQTSYFKYTKKKYGEGKRIFKMSPLHHHFEMCGWSEVKIVTVFTVFTALMCMISLTAMKMTL